MIPVNLDEISAKIKQRRFQILVHSYLYYQRMTSIVEDVTFDRWARELVKLQEQYPDIADTVEFAKDFKGFDATTGFDLPYATPRIQRIGDNLLSQRGKRNV
jgi:NAD-dependent DNA ligase